MQNILIDRERHKVAVQKLNPPCFEYDRDKLIKFESNKHSGYAITDSRMHQDSNSAIRGLILAALVIGAIIICYSYSPFLTALLK